MRKRVQRKHLSLIIIITLIIIAVVLAVIYTINQPDRLSAPASPQGSRQAQPAPPVDTSAPPPAATVPGRYTDYSEAKRSDKAYATNILFFYASWCPECRGFEKAIKQSPLPLNTQILKVDYDSATDLRARYKVTLQSTFVRVDNNGSELAKWVGYGKDKSTEAILSNL